MDADECIDVYGDLASAIFGEKLSRIPVNIKGEIKPSSNSGQDIV
jgi:hypothetical protein